VHLVALHAGHVKTQPGTGRVQERVITGAACTKTKVVAHQHVAHPQRADQAVFDEALGGLAGQGAVEGHHHTLIHPAAAQPFELVAQGGDACGGQFGLLALRSKEIAWVRLKRHDTTGHPALTRLAHEQGQHGLVPTVHTIEVADGQRTRAGEFGVVQSTKNLHGATQSFNKAASASG
jgi:hypothetical protein